MTFIDDIQSAEQKAKSILENADRKAMDIKARADKEMSEKIASLRTRFQEKRVIEIRDLDEEMRKEGKKTEKNTQEKVDALYKRAERNKDAAVKFIIDNI